MFSSRLPDSLARNRLTLAVERYRADVRPFSDLTESNPTRAGFSYPSTLLASLATPAARQYDPQSLGSLTARRAVSADFERRGVAIAPDHVVVTASTSESYSILFKLLCDPGDVVLAPRPSYPLVEHLTRLDGVVAEFYDLEWHGGWTVDLAGLAGMVESRAPARPVRAVIVVNPNNPTGSRVKVRELEAIASLCRGHAMALIADEVFADYPLEEVAGAMPSLLTQSEALTFGLGGMSKTIGLPQVKFGWLGVSGPDDLVTAALERLEAICDTYLSVATPVQVAAEDLMAQGVGIRAQIASRVRDNYRALQSIATDYPACRVLPAEAGWYAVVQVPATRSEESLVLDLLDKARVLVHPGYFFDFQQEAFVVLSLLPPAEEFLPAVERMFREITDPA